MEAAAYLVVDAAHGHAVQRRADHLQRADVAGAQVVAQQELVRHRLRELGLESDAAVRGVEVLDDSGERRGQYVGGERLDAPACGRHRAHLLQQPLGGQYDLAVLLPVGVRDRRQHPREARHAVPVLRGIVGAAVEGLAVRRQKDRHRPAAAAGHRLDGAHVYRVDVGPLLAVDLDADELGVHHLRYPRVFERLALHDVAPVARRIADAQQDGPVLGLRPPQRLIAPRVPVHGIVGVLQQVGARLVDQSVGHIFPRRPTTARQPLAEFHTDRHRRNDILSSAVTSESSRPKLGRQYDIGSALVTVRRLHHHRRHL